MSEQLPELTRLALAVTCADSNDAGARLMTIVIGTGNSPTGPVVAEVITTANDGDFWPKRIGDNKTYQEADGHGNIVNEIRKEQRIVFDRVIRVTIFDTLQAFPPDISMDIERLLREHEGRAAVRFSTSAFVAVRNENGVDTTPPDGALYANSRLEIDTVNVLEDGQTKFAVAGFKIVGHVPLAVHANDAPRAGNKEDLAKQLDARAVVNIQWKRPTGTQSSGLFVGGKRGPNLSWRIGLTGDGSKNDDENWLSFRGPKRGTFSDWADNSDNIPKVRLDQALAQTKPLCGLLADYDRDARGLSKWVGEISGGNASSVIGLREVGFRLMSDSSSEPLMFGLRAELRINIAQSNARTRSCVQALLRPALGAGLAESVAENWKKGVISLAQEQLIDSELGPEPRSGASQGPGPISWLATVRFGTGDEDPSDTGFFSKFATDQLFPSKRLLPPALRDVRYASGLTLMPESAPLNLVQTYWHVVGTLVVDPHTRHVLAKSAGGTVPDLMGTALDVAASLPSRHVDMASLQPRMTPDLWVPGGRENEHRIDLQYPRLNSVTGKPLVDSHQKWEIRPPLSGELKRPAWQPDRIVRGLAFRIVLSKLPEQTAGQSIKSFQIGSLRIQPARDKECSALLQLPPSDRVPPSGQYERRATTQIPVQSFGFVAEDPLPGDAGVREASLVLPIAKGGTSSAAPLVLEAHEVFGGVADQGVTMVLKRAETAPSDGTARAEVMSDRVFVLDPGLFRITEVTIPSPEVTDGASSEIAVYRPGDDGQAAWQFLRESPSVRLRLPPQAIGEAMEKRAGGTQALPADITPNQLVDFRIGSPTILEINPNVRDRRTFEAPINVRRMLNRVGDGLSAPFLRELRLELAYGLVARMVGDGAIRISELGGVYGEAAGWFKGRSIWGKDYQSYVEEILDAQRCRLAVDRVWKGKPDAPFEVTDGVQTRLKTGLQGEAAQFQLPVEGDLSDPTLASLDGTFTTQATSEGVPSGFAGGVPWAFESLNVLREVYENPLSSTARLSGIHLSALGGWGSQRAVFANGKTVIETETDMGRMSHYKLERLGRIGGLHNRAKHVIVYSRTTVPSAQFFNRDKRIGRKQDDLAGRPILRKVEEYIEILQPERRYPEDGVSVREAACLAGSRFVSTRILVDSQWGGDVGKAGWAVPLWRKDLLGPSADGSPGASALYPKPVITLLHHGEDGELVASEVDSPEVLQFFTSTRPQDTGELIDQWASVESIDYCDRPPPVAGRWPDRKLDDSLGDATLPAPERVPPGHEALTLILKDGAAPSRIGAGRIDGGPSVVLKSVTIGRSAPAPTGIASTPAAQAADIGRDLQTLASEARAAIDVLVVSGPAELERAVRSLRLDTIGDLKGRAKGVVNRVSDRLILQIEQERARLLEKLKQLEGRIPAGSLDANKLVNALLDPVDARVTGVLQRLWKDYERLLQGPLTGALDEAKRTLKSAGEQLDKLDQVPDAQLKAHQEDLLKELGVLDSRLKQLQAEANAWVGQMLDRLAIGWGIPLNSARQALVQLRLEAFQPISDWVSRETAWLLTVPDQINAWSLDTTSTEAQFEALKNKILEVIKSIRMIVEGAKKQIEGVRDQINKIVGPSDAQNPLPARVKAALDELLLLLNAMDTQLNEQLPLELTQLENTVIQWTFPPSQPDLDSLKTGLNQAIDPLIQATSQLSESVLGGLARLDGWALQSERLLEQLDGFVESKIEDLQDVLRSQLSAVAASITEKLEQIKQIDLSGLAPAAIAKYKEACSDLKNNISTTESCVRNIEDVLGQLGEVIKSSLTDSENKLGLAGQWSEAIKQARRSLQRKLDQWLPSVLNLQSDVNDAINGIYGAIGSGAASAAELINAKRETLLKAIDDLADDGEQAVLRATQELRRQFEEQYGGLARQIGSGIDEVLANGSRFVDAGVEAQARAEGLYRQADGVLRLFRAVGDPPKADGLDFNRPEVAYVLDAARDIIDVTPGLALVNRARDTAQAIQEAGAAAGELLEGLGLRLPVNGLLDEYVPAGLQNLSLSRMFPKMAGLDLENLFAKAGFPSLGDLEARNGIKVTRGFDREAREAWLKAEIDVPLDRSAEVLSFGSIGVFLDKGRFRASARIARGQDGTIRQTGGGRIDGDWRLMTAGMEVVVFERTPLIFSNSGRLDFPVSADRIRLAPTLRFLTDLTSKFSLPLPPWLEIIEQAGIPVGMRSKFEAGPMDLSAGAFSVTNLTLIAGFGLVVAPRFEITTRFDIAQPDAPFMLRVWILTGGGYIRQNLRYLPSERPGGLIEYSLEVSIAAGVGLDFSFGVVRGAVGLALGCSVRMFQTNAGGSTTAVTAYMLAYGHVDIKGLVSANISLLLAITYDGAVMLATGTLRLSFRISVFYTLKVSQRAQYKIAGQERRKSESSDQYSEEFA